MDPQVLKAGKNFQPRLKFLRPFRALQGSKGKTKRRRTLIGII